MADSPVGAAGAGSAGAAGAGSVAASIPLASALAGGPISFINADVALDGEPVVGSFTVDGLTFAVAGDGFVELVGVSSQSLAALDVPTDLNAASAASETEADDTVLVLPESVSFEGADYALTSIAPYAFYLSGVTSVELPATVTDVDDRAFRSSDLSSVEVDSSNRSFASFDGILYDADLTRLLLIPGGRTGAARISSKAEEVDAAAFSHCAGVTAISVDAGSDHLSSWDGLLYDADGTTLLRVPAGATDITIREGCTTIAAGAMEGCAQLATITAPASVTSISPDVFASVPTVSLPAATLTGEAPQLTALVALSATDDDLPKVNPADIAVYVVEALSSSVWSNSGFHVQEAKEAAEPIANIQNMDTYAAEYGRGFSSIAGYANTQYYRGDTAPYFLNGSASLWVGWTKGTSTVPDDDAQANFFVSGYASGSPIYSANPAYVWELRNRWVREDCGPLMGFVSSYGNYITLEDIEKGTFNFSLPGNCFNKNSLFEFGWGFDPVFYRALHTYALNYPNAPEASKFYSDTGGKLYCPPAPTRTGYTFVGWFDTSASTGGKQIGVDGGITIAPYLDTKYYGRWKVNSYTIVFDSREGAAAASVDATYNADVKLPTTTRQGYIFKGWDTKADGTGTRYEASATVKNLTSEADAKVTLFAQWEPVVSADVPLDVTAKVDLLGIEEQEEAQGYIESRCGEPLDVADVAFTPLAGAADLFGTANVADVALEVLAAGSTSPDARFALDASASQAPATPTAFRMASYGTRVPISYRFDIPDELLPGLVEITKPVCSVAYTVKLA